PSVLLFDRFALDLARERLRAGEQDIDLRPKAFKVLRYLVENAGRLVLKEDLFEAVWPNVQVSDDTLVQCIREIAQHLEGLWAQVDVLLPRTQALARQVERE